MKFAAVLPVFCTAALASPAVADVRVPYGGGGGGTIVSGPGGFRPNTYQPAKKGLWTATKQVAERGALYAGGAAATAVAGTSAAAVGTVVTILGVGWLAYDVFIAD